MTNQRLCTACDKPNREQARFCGYCGHPLQDRTPTRANPPHGQRAAEWDRETRRGPAALQTAEPELSDPQQKNIVGKAVKLLSFTIITVALLWLLAYTNPTLESYEGFVHQQIIQESQNDDASRALGLLFGGFASRFVAGQTVRKDYVFLSTYDTNLGDEHLRALGILNNFYILETPRSFKARH